MTFCKSWGVRSQSLELRQCTAAEVRRWGIDEEWKCECTGEGLQVLVCAAVHGSGCSCGGRCVRRCSTAGWCYQRSRTGRILGESAPRLFLPPLCRPAGAPAWGVITGACKCHMTSINLSLNFFLGTISLPFESLIESAHCCCEQSSKKQLLF